MPSANEAGHWIARDIFPGLPLDSILSGMVTFAPSPDPRVIELEPVAISVVESFVVALLYAEMAMVTEPGMTFVNS